MERYTSHCGAINGWKTYYPKSNFVTGDCFQNMLNQLGKYEDSGLSPEEVNDIMQLAEKMNICDIVRENLNANNKIRHLEVEVNSLMGRR